MENVAFMPNHKLFRAGLWLLLIFLLIWVGSQINYVFLGPLVTVIQTLLTPLLIAGLLFFLLRSPVKFLVARKVPKVLAIFAIYLVFIGLIALLLVTVGPKIQAQFGQLSASLPEFIQNAVTASYEVIQSDLFSDLLASSNINIDEWAAQASQIGINVLNMTSGYLSRFVGAVVNFVLVLVMVPFILFYFLKDGNKMFEGFLLMIPLNRREPMRLMLQDLDKTIGQFIRGQFTVALCVGILLWTGYQIIGLKFAIVLALFSMVTNVIPYVGAFIAAVPAVLVGLAQSPSLALKVLIVCIVAQQLEGNLLSPWIVGKGLNIHPLTIILVLLAAGAFMGPLGLLLAVPVYAVLRIVITHWIQWKKTRPHDSPAG
jgi:predicted PurR-regulated permease PerM